MGIYTIRASSFPAGRGYLNVEGNHEVSPNRNVNVYQNTGSADQQWVIANLGNGVTQNVAVYSQLTATLPQSQKYALNPKRVGDKWNCDILLASGNATDSAIKFEPYGTGTYRIQLTNWGNKFLTADSSTNNAYWYQATGSASQQWYVTLVNDTPDPPSTTKYHLLAYRGHGRSINVFNSASQTSLGQKIGLWDWTTSGDQKWIIQPESGYPGYARIISGSNTSLALGYAGNKAHNLDACELMSKTNTNTRVYLEGTSTLFKVRLTINGQSRYLTPWYGTGDAGSNLLWLPNTGFADQYFKRVSDTSSYSYAHTSTKGYFWPSTSNASIVNDGYMGIWRQYSSTGAHITTNHKGVDLSNAGKARAMFAGTVTEKHTANDTDRGLYVKVRASDGTEAIYQHLASIDSTVVQGQSIAKGVSIGVIGGTGGSTTYGAHLHFEILRNGAPVDPLMHAF